MSDLFPVPKMVPGSPSRRQDRKEEAGEVVCGRWRRSPSAAGSWARGIEVQKGQGGVTVTVDA